MDIREREHQTNDQCKTCDKKLNPGWNYCPRCGREQHVNPWGDEIDL
jgi:predicted amidophosphoribosyltransferase